MSDRGTIFWLIAGVPVAIIDAWLSIQSIFGLLEPTNLAGIAAATIVGASLTGVTVYVPILREARPSALLSFFWFIVFVIDMGTSIVGAIWYGVLNNSLNSAVDFSMLKFDPSNWLVTSVFIAFVLIMAGGCIELGKALSKLNKNYNQRHSGR